jgi:hypothetical protein
MMLLQVIYFVLIVCLDEGFAAFSSSIETRRLEVILV